MAAAVAVYPIDHPRRSVRRGDDSVELVPVHDGVDSLFTRQLEAKGTRIEILLGRERTFLHRHLEDLLLEVRHFSRGVVVVEFDQIVQRLVLRTAPCQIFFETVLEFELQDLKLRVVEFPEVRKLYIDKRRTARLHRIERGVHYFVDLGPLSPVVPCDPDYRTLEA